uniref:Uncharacterized protein n=1 Tax=Spongospora subterranea TaxID=70186 RepID=A0A0H5RCC9_9EUKA|eukprot:CRZ06156.1 hypothetical protein [Spongospora subterranea]
MWRFMFSGVIIILVGLSFGASSSSEPGYEDLLEAIQKGYPMDEHLVRQIGSQCINCPIEHYGELPENYMGPFDPMPMHIIALIHKRQEIANILFDMGADVYVADRYGNTPLHFASRRGLVLAVEKIIAIFDSDAIKKRDEESKQQALDYTNDEGQTALHWAVIFKKIDVAKMLMTAGANSMIIDRYGYTVLHHAAMFGRNEEIIVDIIKAARPLAIMWWESDLVDLRDKHGRTAYSIALTFELYNIAKILFENGADPTSTIKNGFTLFDAIPSMTSENCFSMIQNTDLNRQYSDGSTPLHCAIQKRWEVVVKELLEGNADPSIKDNLGNTALHLAVMRRLSTDIIADIIRAGESRLVGQDEMNYERVGESSIPDDREINQSGACPTFINVQNRKGEPALSYAISVNWVQGVAILLSNGATCTNKALHRAIKMEKRGSKVAAMIVELLQRPRGTKRPRTLKSN